MPGFGRLLKLARQRATLRRASKSGAALPQYSPMPFSSLTAKSDFIANRKFNREPNPLTSDEQALLERLLAGMSRSRARVVDARRSGRRDVRDLLTGSKLWG